MERDRARGVLDADEAERLRVEVSRRLLAADRRPGAPRRSAEPRRATRAAALLTALAVLAGGLGLYAALGAPGYPDLPIARRIALAEAAQDAPARPGGGRGRGAQACARPPSPTRATPS